MFYNLTKIIFFFSFLPVFVAALLRGSELHQLAQRRLFPSGRDSRQLLHQLLRLQLDRSEECHCGCSQSQQTGEASSVTRVRRVRDKEELLSVSDCCACRAAMSW